MKEWQPKHTLSVIYVVLLSLGPLFSIVWLMNSDALLRSIAGVGEYESLDSAANLTMVILVPIVLYVCACVVFGVIDIVRSFRAFRLGREDFCVASMLVHKYGLVAFFILNFLLCFLLIGGGAFAAIVATRGAGILFSPMFLAMGTCAGLLTYLAILPGSFYGVQTIRFARLRGFTSSAMAVVHGIFQFLFLTDVLDAMYLSVSKWGRAKIPAVIVGIVYLLFIIAIIGGFLFLMAQLLAA